MLLLHHALLALCRPCTTHLAALARRLGLFWYAGDEGLGLLEDALCTTRAFTSLSMAKTQLTDHSAPIFERLPEFVPKLQHFDVSWNQLGPLSAQALAQGLHPGKALSDVVTPVVILGQAFSHCLH